MMPKIVVAFYKGRKRDNPHTTLRDRIISFLTNSPYSHCELIESMSGTHAITWGATPDGVDRGVRDLSKGEWVLVEFYGDIDDALTWFRVHRGLPYDWLGVLGIYLPFRIANRDKWFCSEALAVALGIARSIAQRLSPGRLFTRLQLMTTSFKIL